MDLSEPPPLGPKNPQFIETEPSKESAEKPKDQTFESNANSMAASNMPPATEICRCRARMERIVPIRNLETHDFSLQTQGSQPQPSRSKLRAGIEAIAATTSKAETAELEPPKPRCSSATRSSPSNSRC